MGFLLIPIFLIYLLLAAVIIAAVVRWCRSRAIIFSVIAFFVVFPFRRLIFFNVLFFFYSLSPLQEIHETVEFPLSVYWVDNVWPGFDVYGRRWMVGNYLDGRHLQVLALKGDDGKIYLYRADEESFSKSRALCPDYRERIEAFIAEAKEATAEYRRSGYYNAIWKSTLKKRDAFNNGIGRQYQQLRALEVTKIINRVEIFTDKSDLPPIRYRVEFTLLPETFLINSRHKILHADRISIVDMRSGKEIAFSTRYMAHSWTKYLGDPSTFDYKLGDEQPYDIDDRVLFKYGKVNSNYESKRSRLDY